ncbi:hypothetical protein Hokovirus_2_79 [Hokovirus HKV1]|uniref:Uncharacterized protein n=1 Tax=Hokovirus HKV1 TaxID=1977638 RepID=A0A1V0SFQ9_9VIRU|nr:hypothetical protein Hokovirus_2_79 [Hokovirus HKV1]
MDNFFTGCPARMSDQGRSLSNFKVSNRYNEEIRILNGIYRDDEYRQFLQRNGEAIMKSDTQYYKSINSDNCQNKLKVHVYPISPTTVDFINERKNYDFIMNPQNTLDSKLARITSSCQGNDFVLY